MALLLATVSATSANAQRRQMQMTDEQKYLDAMHRNITSDKLFGYVEQLSDSTLEGRLAGSPGMAKAVSIVENYFREWGLKPAGDNGSYIQEYSHPCVEVFPGSTMEILFPVYGQKRKDTVWISNPIPGLTAGSPEA